MRSLRLIPARAGREDLIASAQALLSQAVPLRKTVREVPQWIQDLRFGVLEPLLDRGFRETRQRWSQEMQATDSLANGSSQIWSVRLAQRGWEVTGIDIVSKAVRKARRRARAAGLNTQFVEGNIATLAAVGIGSGFKLILDFGVVHGLLPGQVQEVGCEVTAVAAEDATLVMYAFSPGRRGPLPRGISRQEIEQAYEGWKVTHEEAFDLTDAPLFVQAARPQFYSLRRRLS